MGGRTDVLKPSTDGYLRPILLGLLGGVDLITERFDI